jgi:DnaJ-class molecular chaperone
MLGVPYSATSAEITRAYRGKMKRAHPDRQRPERRAAAEEIAKGLNLAFTVLSNAESREQYDQTLKATAVQDQIMQRYSSGFGGADGSVDPLGEALRRERTPAERAETRHADRSATASVLLAFGGVAIFAIVILLAWALLSNLASALF